MTTRRSHSIRIQVILLAVVPLAFLVLNLGLVMLLVQSSRQSALISQRVARVHQQSDALQQSFERMSASLQAYSKSHRSGDLVGFDGAKRAISGQEAALDQLVHGDALLQPAAARYVKDVRAVVAVFSAGRSDLQAGHTANLARLMGAPSTKALGKEYNQAKAAFNLATATNVFIATAVSLRSLATVERFLLISASLGVVGTLALAILFGVRTARRLGTLAENARRLRAGEVVTPLTGSDEITQLDGVYRAMFEQIVEANHELERHRAELIAANLRVEEQNAGMLHQNAKLAELNKELESFTYSVSHDLRAPARAVLGYSQIMEEDYGAVLDAEARELLGTIHSEATRMGTLIDDLLELSRLGREELRNGAVEMEALVADVVREQTAHLRTNGLVIDVLPLPAAYGDRTQLRQVWQNLIGNAIKYSQKHEHPTVRISGVIENAEICYHVQDNGVGFDMEYADKLFGVFQRLHRAEDFPGTGVGLAIVHRVISRHGGRVWANAKPGAGATFSFALPLGGAHE